MTTRTLTPTFFSFGSAAVVGSDFGIITTPSSLNASLKKTNNGMSRRNLIMMYQGISKQVSPD